MDKDIVQVLEGVALGQGVQFVFRKYIDPMVAPSLLYSPTKYAVDLKAAGYVVQAVDATASDEQIGQKIVAEGGYSFASGPGNLLGTARLTANKFTYMSAVGQKTAAYMMPSVWGTGVLGVIGVAESMYGFLGLGNKYKLLSASAGMSMFSNAATRALGMDAITAAPSGFDVSATAPPMQVLDRSAMENLKKLSAENQRLQQELSQLRRAGSQSQAQTAQYPRGMPPGVPSYTVSQPVVNVTEIIPGKGAEPIKDRVNLIGGAAIQRATPESVRHQTGLVTLTGGR